MARLRSPPILTAFTLLVGSPVTAEPLILHVGATSYSVDPATLEIAAVTGGERTPIMPPLHAPESAIPSRIGSSWRWADGGGRTFAVSTEEDALRLTVTGTPGSKLSWPLPPAAHETWLIPDGEGMAYGIDDPFWRRSYREEECLGATTALSFPAWSRLSETQALTYALGDGLLSNLCLHDADGLQARLDHQFGDGAETLELFFAVRAPDLLAPSLFYREFLKARRQLRTLTDKSVPKLARLYGAPQAYVWGNGRDLAFLDDLKALGIERINLSYNQDMRQPKYRVGAIYLARVDALGYLLGPYEAFDNGQPAATADIPTAGWRDDLYPRGCIHDAAGKVMPGFAGRGCEMSSEAIARHPQAPSPASRYASHVADGASQVFVDVDAFGEFYADYSPDHPMSMARDRANRLKRMSSAMDQYRLVVGSENVTAWSSSVAHYSHGTAQTNAMAIWPILGDSSRFGGWLPRERPAMFFAPFKPTPDEDRALFAPADRLPLFEAVFHDSVVAADRWEFGLMKIVGEERHRFARSLLYGTPTMWNLDRRELARVGMWLKAAQDDFRIAHGWGAPVALKDFRWLTPNRLVQQASYADGRRLVANFGDMAWRGLAPDCVRVIRPRLTAVDLCPPLDPAVR